MADTTDRHLLPEGMHAAGARSIVVGHDGSPGADRALTEALLLARALDAPVVVVRALLSDTGPCLESFPDVSVEYRVVHAGPAESLVAISHDARLLVVGARGLGGLAGMLLGSVSDQCVRHAACPVLVARLVDGTQAH